MNTEDMTPDKPEKAFKGVWIPVAIWEAPDITWGQKCLLAEIDSLDQQGEGCFASIAYLAKRFGIAESSMANLLSKLTKQGYLEDVSFDGRVKRRKVSDWAKTGKPRPQPSETSTEEQGSHKSEGSVHMEQGSHKTVTLSSQTSEGSIHGDVNHRYKDRSQDSSQQTLPPAGAEGVGSVSGNEGEEEKFPHPSPKEFVTFWNGFSEFEEFVGGEMSGSHRKTLASLRKHEWFRENWQDAIRLVAESDFHTGRTEENFHASPKWFFTQGRAMAWCGKAMRAKRIKTQPHNQKPKQTIKLRTEKEHVPAPEKSPEEQERELQEFLKTLRPKGNGSPIMA